MTFRVLMVCTGNICRSPTSELLLARELAHVDGIEVASAGTAALVDGSIPTPALNLLAGSGVDGSAHRAQQFTPELLRSSDLILAMAREHRRAIVELAPATTRRTFTIREFARVIGHLGQWDGKMTSASADDRLRSAVNVAAGHRGLVPQPSDPSELDVVDPYRRSDDTYRLSYSQLQPAVETVGKFLARAAGS